MSQYLNGNWLKGYSMNPKKRNYDLLNKNVKGLEEYRADPTKTPVIIEEEIIENKPYYSEEHKRMIAESMQNNPPPSSDHYKAYKEISDMYVPNNKSKKNIYDINSVGGRGRGRRLKRRSRRRGAGPKRLRSELENEIGPVVEGGGVIDMEVISREDLAQEYIKALTQIRQTQAANREQEFVNSRNKMLFYSLIFLGLFATYNLLAVPAITDEKLLDSIQTAKDDEYRAQGMNYSKRIEEVAKHVAIITQTRFKFGNGKVYTANQILQFLKTYDILKPLIETLENVYNGYVSSTNKMTEISNFLYNTLLGSLKLDMGSLFNFFGLINMNIMILDVMKPYIKGFFSVYKDVKDIRQMIKNAFYTQDTVEQDTGEVVQVNINNRTKIVKLSEVMRTINTPEPTLVLTWFESFLSALFAHEEAWTADDSSTSSSILTIQTELSNKTIDSLNEINEIGYGDDWQRITDLIKDTLTGPTNSAIEYSALCLSSVYTSLLIMNSDELNQSGGNTQDSQISELTQDSMDFSVRSIPADSIKDMTEHALLKTIQNSNIISDSQKKELIMKFRLNNSGIGGRRRRHHRKHKTRKISRKHKSRHRRSHKKTHKRRR